MENIHASHLEFPVKTQVRDSRRPDRGSVARMGLLVVRKRTMRENQLRRSKVRNTQKMKRVPLANTVYTTDCGYTQGEQSSPSWSDTNIYTTLGHSKRTMKRHIRYTVLMMFQSALYTWKTIMKLSCIKGIVYLPICTHHQD